MSEETFRKIFSSNLKYYLSLYGKTQTDLVNDLGFDKSAVSTWCNGTRLPRMDKVDMLTQYFGIRRSDLLEDRSEVERMVSEFPCNLEEQELLKAYRKASEDTKNAVAAVLCVQRKKDSTLSKAE